MEASMSQRPDPFPESRSRWAAALLVLVLADGLLALLFLLAIAKFNCHGGYECPF
jgi:hypothetical protein